jgi:hypothetical protein
MGISVSDAVRMLLVRVAAEKALPFDGALTLEEPDRRTPLMRGGRPLSEKRRDGSLGAADTSVRATSPGTPLVKVTFR